MKKLLLSSAAVLAFAGSSAFAADLRMPVKAPYAPPPVVTSWTGCYIDGGVGYGMNNQDESISFGGLTSGANTNGGRGWLGRVGGGCDYQFGSSWVIGAFGDYDFMNISGTAAPANFSALGAGGPPVGATNKESSAWYAGGRLGYLISPDVLGFVSGGWTETRFDQRNNYFLLTGATAGISLPAHDYNGWFLGGGFEYAINFLPIHGLYLKTEYRFSQYQTDNLAAFVTATGVPNGAVASEKTYVQTVTTSLVWRFNFGR